MGKEYIYGLVTQEDSDTVFYVGRSVEPARRLSQHIRESKTGNSLKCRVIRRLLEQREDITFKILEEVSSDTPHSAEDVWMVNLQAAGHPLTNSKAGDQDRYQPSVVKTTDPWSSELINKAEWITDKTWATTGKVAWIKGLLFKRTGKSSLTFIHPVYKEVKVPGTSWEDKCLKAARMLTKGTPDNLHMIDQYKQSKSLKPNLYE